VIDQIKVRTLIIVGDQDVAIVPAKAERMHKRIPNSEMVGIPGAGHTSTVEEPKAVTAAMSEFLNKQGS
jgi:3-oxoadipate enol-lactonase